MLQGSHGGGGDSYYYPLQLPPRTSSLKPGHSAYIYPSRRTNKLWGIPSSSSSTERAPTPAIQIPQYILRNPPPQRNQTKSKRQGKSRVVYYPAAVARDTSTTTPSAPREWETDPETDGSTKTTSSGNRRSSARVLPSSSTSKPTYTYKPPRRTFAEYIWQYAQRLRKKGKRVRFVPQPTEIPAAEGSSRGGKSREDRYHQSEGGRRHSIRSAIMGSSLSKPIIGSSSRSRRRSSRDQQPHHAQYVVTDPYSTSRRRGASGEASPSSHRGPGTHTYTYTYPQYPLQPQYASNQYGYQYPPTYSTYEPAPESAYYLGTEMFPALHSLGTTQVKPSGKTRSRGRLPPEYASGVYNTNTEYYAPPPVYRHQHRGTTAGDGGYYISSESSRREKKREREESIARGGGSSSRSGSGREKKLRRAKGVDDIRGRSLRGGYQRGEGHAFGGGWVAVRA